MRNRFLYAALLVITVATAVTLLRRLDRPTITERHQAAKASIEAWKPQERIEVIGSRETGRISARDEECPPEWPTREYVVCVNSHLKPGEYPIETIEICDLPVADRPMLEKQLGMDFSKCAH